MRPVVLSRLSVFLSLPIFILIVCFAFPSPPFTQADTEGKKNVSAEYKGKVGGVALQLKWFHQFQFAGYYAAKEKGYYRDRGLRVEIIEGGPFETTKAVLSGKAQYGVATSEIVLERAMGAPVVVLACIFQHSPHVLIAREEGQASPGIHDLVGKKIRIPSSKRAADIHAMFLFEGISLDKSILVESAGSPCCGDKTVSACNGHVSNEPFFFKQRNEPITIIYPKSYGIDFYGDCIFTTEEEIERYPERADKLVEASIEGWTYALDHVEEIVDLIVDEYDCKNSREHLLYEANEIKRLIEADFIRIGHVNEERWQFIADTYKKLGLCESDFSIDGLVYDSSAAKIERQKGWEKFFGTTAGVIGAILLALYAWNRSLGKKVKQRTSELEEGIAERTKAEKALRKSERKFAETFMSCPTALILSSFENGRFMDVNHVFTTLAGYARKEVVGKTSMEIGLWRDSTQRDRMMDRLRKDGFLKNYEIEFQTASGKTKTGLMSAEIIEIDGKVCMLSQVIDITSLKSAEIALRKSEERYRIVADFAHHWEYWIRPDGRFEYVSPSCERLTGYAADEFVEHPGLLTEIVHEDDRETFLDHIQFHPERKDIPELKDFRIRTRDGRVKWIQHRCRSVFDDGVYLGIRASNRDITERKEIEEKIGISESMFKAINEKTSDVIVILDKNRVYKYVSPSIANVAGFSPNDLIGKTLDFVFEENDLEKATEYLEKAVSNHGKTITAGVLRAKMKNGGYCSIETRITNLLDEPGVEGFVVSSRDVTEKIKLKDELNHAYKMEVIGALAGGIAHDFNNILSSIIGNAELALEDAKFENDPADHIREIIGAGFRAMALTNSILSYSRRSSGNEGACEAGRVLRQSMELLRAAIPSSIKIDLKMDSQSFVSTAPSRLRQLVTILCANRAMAMEKEEGELKIKLKDVEIDEKSAERFRNLNPGRHVELTVWDARGEIGEECIDLIAYGSFATKKDDRCVKAELANAREIVSALGGEILIDEKDGRGTVFRVYLPAVPDFSESEKGKTKDRFRRNENILIVDDNGAFVNMTGKALERFGFKVAIIADSVEALDFFNSDPSRFDLVITDLVMPGLTGEELSIAMLATRPDIPIILCTGFSKALSEEKALEIGIRAVVYKPFVIDELAKTIRSVLDKTERL